MNDCSCFYLCLIFLFYLYLPRSKYLAFLRHIADTTSPHLYLLSSPLLYHQVQDTCGAGDAFAGAFLVEFLRSSGQLGAALQAGCVAGTAAVQLVGGSSVPCFELLATTSSATTATARTSSSSSL
jgi:hypothetical protein